jgi:hypothetical protein
VEEHDPFLMGIPCRKGDHSKEAISSCGLEYFLQYCMIHCIDVPNLCQLRDRDACGVTVTKLSAPPHVCVNHIFARVWFRSLAPRDDRLFCICVLLCLRRLEEQQNGTSTSQKSSKYTTLAPNRRTQNGKRQPLVRFNARYSMSQ